MSNPSYYAHIPASVRYCEDLVPNAKLLYGEISALTGKQGFCWATNSYFAELYKVGQSTISEWISALSKHRFIRVSIDPKRGNERKLFLCDDPHRHFTDTSSAFPEEGSSEKTDSHYRDQYKNEEERFVLKSDKEKKPRQGSMSISKPTQPEVETFFITSLSLPETDGEWFFHSMEACGWTRGKSPIKNWQAHARAWKSASIFPSQKQLGGAAFAAPQKVTMTRL